MLTVDLLFGDHLCRTHKHHESQPCIHPPPMGEPQGPHLPAQDSYRHRCYHLPGCRRVLPREVCSYQLYMGYSHPWGKGDLFTGEPAPCSWNGTLCHNDHSRHAVSLRPVLHASWSGRELPSKAMHIQYIWLGCSVRTSPKLISFETNMQYQGEYRKLHPSCGASQTGQVKGSTL